ncbi:MAG: NlpC/P60 family protein [Acidimicrobiales bacterium]
MGLRAVAALLFIVLLPGVAGAQPADRGQTVDSLKAKAAAIAAQLDDLDQKTNTLDEQYNNATLELDGLKAKLGENQAKVDQAKTQLEATRVQAQKFAVQAYMGTNDTDSSLVGVSDDAADASRRRTYLAARFGNSSDVIDGLVASQKDLADREAALEAANAKVDAKVAEITASKQDLEATIADRQKLYASVKGELAAAVAAEQERLAKAAAAKAEADARAAAARAAAARRPQAVAVRATVRGGAGGSTLSSVVAEVPASRNITPPPANAPTAVRVALEQQGDPYVWAADGPDSFDCSGLVLFAYRAAGVQLPHSSRGMRAMTRSITADELQPGDLVFGGSPVHHVGLYIGNGQMVHAPHSGDVVRVASIYSTSKPVSFGRL